MNRAMSVLVWPSLVAFVALAATGLGLALIHQANATPDDLNVRIYERAMEDRTYLDRIMEEVRGGMAVVVFSVAVVVWLMVVGWFLLCWKKPIEAIGAPRRMRPTWLLLCLIGVLLGFGAAVYTLFRHTQLPALATWNLGFYATLILFSVAAYYATTVLLTHRVYISAIPWSRWRPW